MSLLPLLLVLCAAPLEGTLTAGPPEGKLVYEGPFLPSEDPSAYTFTTYDPGDKPFLAVDEANLRGSASIDAPVVRTLRLGSQVEVLEVVSEALLVKDRVDRWYRVRTPGDEPQEGFVLGNVLTPLAVTGDLDGDGKEESLAVSFTSDFVVRVRVLEPELATRRKKAVAALDFLLPKPEPGKRGGQVQLVKVHAQEPGVTMSPNALGLELCAADCVVHAVSYTAAKGSLGELSVPPELRGDVRLYPRPRRLFSLRLESEARGPDEDVPCHVIAQVRWGQFRQEDVLSCVVSWPGKSAPDSRSATYYVMRGDKQLLRLGEEDDYTDNELDRQLRRRGYRVMVDSIVDILGLDTPPVKVLYEDARGQLRLQRRTREAYVRSAAEVAFVHPILGTVMMTRQGANGVEKGNPITTNGFFVTEPDGGFLFYAYERGFSDKEVSWKKEQPQGVDYTLVRYSLAQYSGCEVEKTVDFAPPDVRAADLEEVGEVKDAGPIFALKRGTHPEVERAWEEWTNTPRYNQQEERFPSQEAFFASTPRLYWRDSFGRLLRLRRADLRPPCMAEPIVYFYPEQRSRVRYTLAPVVRVSRSEPRVRGNSWTFLASPQGILEEVEAAAPGRARRTFAHLFWDGISMHFSPPAEGVCVPSARSSAFFREVLPRLGLLPHETEDFVAAWVPRMEGAAFHVIGFHPREDVDALAPVEVSPPPAHMIRILMDATPVEACPAGLTPPSLPDAPPAREGFTVVEWGGVLREGH